LTSDVLILVRSWCMHLGRILTVVLSSTPLAPVAFADDIPLNFNIPSQSLSTALERYGDITDRNILYNSNLVVGRRSAAVEGQLSPDVALTRLLEGTHLSAVRITATSFTLLLSAPIATAALPRNAVTDYYGRIQLSLHDALCGTGSARPGNYRIGMRLWIDPAGSVTQFERLNSTGELRVDAGIDQALRHLKIGGRPPPGLGQPVSVVILPQGPGVTMSCPQQAAVEIP
jgi:hypothetical protein